MGNPVDLRLKQKQDGGFDIDWTADGDFEMTDGYDTAVIMSLLCERRAKSYEIALPQYRRGWVGNLLYQNQDEDGSGIWLYKQKRLTGAMVNGVRDEAEKGLLWFIDDSIATQVNVKTAPVNGKVSINCVLITDKQEISNTTIIL